MWKIDFFILCHNYIGVAIKQSGNFFILFVSFFFVVVQSRGMSQFCNKSDTR